MNLPRKLRLVLVISLALCAACSSLNAPFTRAKPTDVGQVGDVPAAIETARAEFEAGRTGDALARVQSLVWGEAVDDSGAVVRSRLVTPAAYLLTAMTAVRAATGEEITHGHVHGAGGHHHH